MCVALKGLKTNPRAPIVSKQAEQPLEKIAMDIPDPLPITPQGNKYVLVVAHYFL